MHIDSDNAFGFFDYFMWNSGAETAAHELLAHGMGGVSFRKNESETIVYERSQVKIPKLNSRQRREILENVLGKGKFKVNQGQTLESAKITDKWTWKEGEYKRPNTSYFNSLNGARGSVFEKGVGIHIDSYNRQVIKKQ